MKYILLIALALCASFSYAQETETTWEGLNLSEYPYINAGFGYAERYSGRKNKLVIYISGGQGTDKPEPYTALEYSQLLYEAFKNPDFTNFPTEIVVFYDEEGKDRATKASVIICGEEFKTKSDKSIFSPMAIGNNIDLFTKAFAERQRTKKHRRTVGF